jgi:hypothetical protein
MRNSRPSTLSTVLGAEGESGGVADAGAAATEEDGVGAEPALTGPKAE